MDLPIKEVEETTGHRPSPHRSTIRGVTVQVQFGDDIV